MRLKKIKIRSISMSVDIKTTDHNSLRWTALAIDLNYKLSRSLIENSLENTVLLTDSIYLLKKCIPVLSLPKHTHILLWDGINSYIELLNKQADILERKDLKFFVVGWIDKLMTNNINISPLYPPNITADSRSWNQVLVFNHKFYVPFWYRLLTSCLTYSRYYKNSYGQLQKHMELRKGERIVFCGLVTPSNHSLNAFFIGVDIPEFQEICLKLTLTSYLDDSESIDNIVEEIIKLLNSEKFLTISHFACVYSVLNLLHRIKTLSILRKMSNALFINEPKNSRRFDPYDSFFYQNNLYLDFGSTRGPDAVYPRTIDMFMTGKKFVSLRFLSEDLTLKEYIENITPKEFLELCENQALLVIDEYNKLLG